jgi:glycosyltransferase involved in cell wall biosynthesis
VKINYVLSALAKSGGANVVYRYAELLNEKGHDVVIYKSILSYNLHRYDDNIKNVIHQIYCSGKALRRSFIKTSSYDKFVLTINDKWVRNADVTIATAWPTAYQVAALAEEKGKKFYFIQDYEIWDNMKWGENSYTLPLKKIVISSWINEQFKKNMGLGPYPVLYNGIDLSKFKTDPSVERDKFCCLMLNHSLEKKGVKQGVLAFEKARAKYPSLKLIMFGLYEKTGLPEYVEYHQNPVNNELIALYSRANIFIFPSLEEGWGLTPLEAMACGCSVVGTNTGFVLDIGENRHNMLISEQGQADEMAKNIVELLSNRELCELIKKSASPTVEKLDWSNSVLRLENMLREL